MAISARCGPVRLRSGAGSRQFGEIGAGSPGRSLWAPERRAGDAACTGARCLCCGPWSIPTPAPQWRGLRRGGRTSGRATRARSPSRSRRPATGGRRAGSLASCSTSTSMPRPGSTGTASPSRAVPRRAMPPAGLPLPRGRPASKPNRQLAIGAGWPITKRKTGAPTSATRSPQGMNPLRIRDAFGAPIGLVRVAGDPDSGLDSTAAWAVRPFSRQALFPAVRRTLLRLVAVRESRFGLVPSQNWDGGEDPWTAPTAWSAWALAALAREETEGATGRREGRNAARRDRRAALTLLADLRRAATPLYLLPERVDAETGAPASTTPLAWSHAFAVLALRAMWPSRRPSR
jgi:hypothetical protein